MSVRDSIQRISTASSTPSSPLNPKEWAWGWRSAARSSRLMAATYRYHPSCPMAVSFSLPCQQGSIGEGPTMRPSEVEPTVVVIDDDEEIREGLQGLLGSVGLRVELFAGSRISWECPPGPSWMFCARCPAARAKWIGFSR